MITIQKLSIYNKNNIFKVSSLRRYPAHMFPVIVSTYINELTKLQAKNLKLVLKVLRKYKITYYKNKQFE